MSPAEGSSLSLRARVSYRRYELGRGKGTAILFSESAGVKDLCGRPVGA